MDNLDAAPRFFHPYRSALLILAGLTALLALPALISALVGAPDVWWLYPSAVASGVFALFLFIVWIAGWIKTRQMAAFLQSARPLVCWTYTADEWAQIRAQRHEETAGDWKVQLGCMTAILAAAGLLTGLLIGADQGWSEAIVGSSIGLALGAAAGALMGAVIAGGHILAEHRADRSPPGIVALGPDEILTHGDYFRGNGAGRRVRDARLEGHAPLLLIVDLWAPKVRGSPEETWVVPVPEDLAKDVKAALPLLAPHRDAPENE